MLTSLVQPNIVSLAENSQTHKLYNNTQMHKHETTMHHRKQTIRLTNDCNFEIRPNVKHSLGYPSQKSLTMKTEHKFAKTK